MAPFCVVMNIFFHLRYEFKFRTCRKISLLSLLGHDQCSRCYFYWILLNIRTTLVKILLSYTFIIFLRCPSKVSQLPTITIFWWMKFIDFRSTAFALFTNANPKPKTVSAILFVFSSSQQTKDVSFHSKQRQVVNIALLLGFLSLHFSATRINEIFHLWFSYGNRFRLMQTIGLFHWIWTLTD